MAVRKGDQAKELISQKLLEIAPEAFAADKKVYVPIKEDGGEVWIAVSMAVPKTLPTAEPRAKGNAAASGHDWSSPVETPPAAVELSAEDKEKVAKLRDLLGI